MTAPSPPPDGSGNQVRPPPRRRKLSVDQGLALIVAAVIGATAGHFGTTATTADTPSPAPTVTVTASPSPAVPNTHLIFSLTANSHVPWCQTYSGTGTIPAGYVLVIFDTPAGPDGQPTSPAYYAFDSNATQLAAGHWQTEPLQIGTPHQANINVEIVGVLTSKSVYRYINSVLVRNNVPWWSTKLPPGPEISLPVITNGQQGMVC